MRIFATDYLEAMSEDEDLPQEGMASGMLSA